jgi:hypothetical protein
MKKEIKIEHSIFVFERYPILEMRVICLMEKE